MSETGDGFEIAANAPSIIPGRDRIERLSVDSVTGDLRSWDWGAITKSRKGRITLDLPPWMD